MKNLKLTAVFAFIVLFNLTTKAQNISIKAGLTMADISMSDNSGATDQYNKMKKNVHFGIFMDRKMNDLISFETGLMFDQKGTKQIFSSGGNTMTNLVSLSTLNLPISLKIGLDASEDIRIFGKIGGYGGYNLGASLTTEVLDNAGVMLSNTTNDLQIGTDAAAGDQIKPVDFGAAFGAGIQYKRLSFEVGFDMGLANLATDQSSGENYKNKELKFSLGYHFGK
jgi:hypothetical protein